MADFFIRRPIVAMVIAILTVIMGLISLKRLPISEYPPVSPTMIQATTTYRGAAAEAVMESVASPIESKVNGVDKLLYMQSYNTNDGKLTLNMYFDVGTDVDIMQVNAQNRVGQAEAQLPAAVKQEGVIVNRSSPDILMVIGLNSPKGTYDAIFLGNYCDINLVDAIKRVKGVGDVKNYTAQDYSMRIWLRPDRLDVLGITPQDIANAIKEQNAQSPAGRVGAEPAPPGQEMQFNVRALGLLKDPKEFEEIIIRSNPNGSQVKIKDVARVELGAQTYDLRARLNKTPAGAIGIYLAPGANAIETADNVKKILEEAKTRFPPDMAYDITLDSTLPIKASMDEIVHTLFEAVILVLIVVYIFLQSFRATIIPMCTVPVSLLGAFIMFPALGFSVNVLTMFGLVLAIGIVVDDAIVVVEAVQHHLEHGMTPVEATRQAMKEVSGPVVAIGLVLCAVFVPVAFMGGVTGQLYSQFALTIAVAVVFSVINALTLSPALAALLLKKPTPGRGPIAAFFKLFNRGFDWVTQKYGRIVGGMVRKAVFSMLLLVVVVWAASCLLGKHVPGGFIPDEDKGYLFVAVQLPEGASLQRTDEVMKQVEEIVTKTPGVRSALAIVGLNILNSLNFPNTAMMFVGLEPWEERKSPELQASAIAHEWTKKFAAIPGARAFAFGPPPLPGYGNVSGFTMQLQDRSGGSIEQLAGYVQKLQAEAAKRPELGRVSTTFNPSTPQVKVELDREKARTLGVPVDSVFQTLQAYLSGLYVNDFVRFGKVYKVFLQAEPNFTNQPEEIGQFYVRNNAGKMVPLNTLVTDRQDVRPELGHPLQSLQCRRDHGRAGPRLQLRPGDQGHRGSNEDHAQRSRLRMVRPHAAGKEIRGPGADRLRRGGALRLPAARGPIRKLGTALRGAAGHADRHPRPDDRHVRAPLRVERLCADRPDHAHRSRGQERHSHRRVRQDETRRRCSRPRCGHRRRAAATAADPDDLLRLHPRVRALDARHRFGRRSAQHHGHRRRLRHDHRHGDRPLPHSGLLRLRAANHRARREEDAAPAAG